MTDFEEKLLRIVQEAIEAADGTFCTLEDVVALMGRGTSSKEVWLYLSSWSGCSFGSPIDLKEKVDADTGRPIWRLD